MNSLRNPTRSQFSAVPVRCWKANPRRLGTGWIALGAAIATLAAPGVSLRAAVVPVANPSFESPAVPPFPALPAIDSWQKTPDPGFPPQGGLTWNDFTGVFANTTPDQPNHIDNIDGNQAAYLFSIPGVGFFQDLGATYGVGLSYNVTLGVIGGGGGMPEGGSLLLQLYYRDAMNTMVPVGGLPITHSLAAFPTTTHFQDFTLNLPAVQAGDAWAGHNIGVEVLATFGTGQGYWDVDNLRLEAVPEPSAMALLGLGAAWIVAWRVRQLRRA